MKNEMGSFFTFLFTELKLPQGPRPLLTHTHTTVCIWVGGMNRYLTSETHNVFMSCKKRGWLHNRVQTQKQLYFCCVSESNRQ